MLETYKHGHGDLHLVTGANINDLKADDLAQRIKHDKKTWKPARDNAKAVNFGMIYGMMAPSFRVYARDNYGVHLTEQQAEDWRDRFFQTYPRLLNWHEHEKDTARRFGFVRSHLGRIRHLPTINSRNREARSKAERQAINSSVQADLSDMCLLALERIEAELPSDKVQLIGMIHDAGVGYVEADNALYWLKRVKEVAENLPLHMFGWKPQIEFPVDLEYGPTLGDMEEVEEETLLAA